eukprot:1160128-Pelagomonas_calceolata.AAC.7
MHTQHQPNSASAPRVRTRLPLAQVCVHCTSGGAGQGAGSRLGQEVWGGPGPKSGPAHRCRRAQFPPVCMNCFVPFTLYEPRYPAVCSSSTPAGV